MSIKNYSYKEYQNYLQTDKWRTKRIEIAKLNNYTCQKCHKVVKSGFHIHHKTYTRLGNERNSDLMFLCEECHTKLHQEINKKRDNKKVEYIECPYCLSKLKIKELMKNGTNKCKYCNGYIYNVLMEKLKEIKRLNNSINKS